ncbi:MAG TPA: hypothetical protein VGM77_07220 [Gemmatimonadales bacterium]|jgi:hypothetical protein
MNRQTYCLTALLVTAALGGCSSSIADDTAPVTQPAVNTLAYAPVDSKGPNLGKTLTGIVTSLSCILSDTIAVDIGPNGGTVSFGGGTLTIQPGVLQKLTHIVALPALVPGTVAVQFFPEGLTFSKGPKPQLTLNTDCIGNPKNAYIEYTDDNGRVLEIKLNTSHSSSQVSADIDHFSRYAVAW